MPCSCTHASARLPSPAPSPERITTGFPADAMRMAQSSAINDLNDARGPASTASTLASMTLWMSQVASRRSATISPMARSVSRRPGVAVAPIDRKVGSGSRARSMPLASGTSL